MLARTIIRRRQKNNNMLSSKPFLTRGTMPSIVAKPKIFSIILDFVRKEKIINCFWYMIQQTSWPCWSVLTYMQHPGLLNYNRIGSTYFQQTHQEMEIFTKRSSLFTTNPLEVENFTKEEPTYLMQTPSSLKSSGQILNTRKKNNTA